MGTLAVDQIDATGSVVRAPDATLGRREREEVLTRHLPGAVVETHGGVRAVRFGGDVILSKQVTHLGFPWPEFKKRIQIPKTWIAAHEAIARSGMNPRSVGIYRYGAVVIFVDFDPETYVARKANNSAAHVSTNDLHQAQVRGEFSRTDANGNRLSSVRADRFAEYLRSGRVALDPHLEVITRFNAGSLTGETLLAVPTVQEMYTARWPDAMQGEWPGFYLEYRFKTFLEQSGLDRRVRYVKEKRRGEFDYDLSFHDGEGHVEHYGDLKASDHKKHESPGNDAEDVRRCVEHYGRFWYVVYEHETHRSRDNGNIATIEWSAWKRSIGYRRAKGYDPLSYWPRFKESVRFVQMMVLEVNEANFATVLGDFAQGQQPSGSQRALKVMIRKRNIENFLIASYALPSTR